MQYLLTHEEYHSLIPASLLNKAESALEEARIKILKLSNFQCIHSGSILLDYYCDDCPVYKMENKVLVCKKPKNVSK